MVKKFLLPAALILASALGAMAQTQTLPRGVTQPKSRPPGVSTEPVEQDLNMPEEMRVRLAIERANNEYRKILEDADRLNELSTEIAKGYHEHGQLNPDELKKLSAIEKLAKRLLSQAGGDQVDDNSTGQKTMDETVDRMSTAAATVQKTLKEQTRFVVSATAISNLNDVINLVQSMRRRYRAD
jgi:hypothetical protein